MNTVRLQVHHIITMLLDAMKQQNVLPDERAYSLILSAYAFRADIDRCLGVLSMMRSAGLTPNVSTYTELLRNLAHVANKKWLYAQTILDDMRKHGISPNHTTFAVLLSLCVRYHDARRAEYFFRQMRDAGLKPNAINYTIFAQVYAAVGELSTADAVLDTMLAEGVKPTPLTFMMLMQAHRRAGDHEGMRRVFQRMLSLGIRPDSHHYTLMMQSNVESGNHKEVMRIYEKMRQEGLMPDRLTYHALISLACERGESEAMQYVLREMKQHDIPPDAGTFSLIAYSFARMGMAQMAWSAVAEMLAHQHEESSMLYSTMIRGFAASGDIESMLECIARQRRIEPSFKPRTQARQAGLLLYAKRRDFAGGMAWYADMQRNGEIFVTNLSHQLTVRALAALVIDCGVDAAYLVPDRLREDHDIADDGMLHTVAMHAYLRARQPSRYAGRRAELGGRARHRVADACRPSCAVPSSCTCGRPRRCRPVCSTRWLRRWGSASTSATCHAPWRRCGRPACSNVRAHGRWRGDSHTPHAARRTETRTGARAAAQTIRSFSGHCCAR